MREGGGVISPPLPGRTPVLDVNRALRLWAVSLDMSHQHVDPLYVLHDWRLERKAVLILCIR